MKHNPMFGWILKDFPNFWQDNGYQEIDTKDYHYYGLTIPKANRFPVYRKQLYINYDGEEESFVEVFPCDIGYIKHDYIVAIHIWNNAGWTGSPLRLVTQVMSIDRFNKIIEEYIGAEVDGGTYLLKINGEEWEDEK